MYNQELYTLSVQPLCSVSPNWEQNQPMFQKSKMAMVGQNALYLAKTAPKIGTNIAPEVLKQPLRSVLAPAWGQNGPCLEKPKWPLGAKLAL